MKIKLNNVRASFVKLFKAEAVGDGETKYFSCSLLFDEKHPAKKLVEDAVRTVAKEKWGPKADQILKTLLADPSKICLKNGDSKAEYDGFEGNWFVSASRQEKKGRPLVIDRDKSPLAEGDGKPYSGCYVNASVEVWAQDNKWGKKLNCELLGVQFHSDGDAFSGGATADADDFDEIEAPETEDDIA
jgi:hypothetical protein